MKKLGLLLFAAITMIACSVENENTMYVKAKVKGLKKGTFYLQKQIDSMIVSVDSVSVNGKDEFMMTDLVLSPEMYYLTLGNTSKRLPFFGEKDTVYISTQLDLFSVKARIKGSANQKLLDEFNEIQKKFSNQRLDLVKDELDARRSGSQDSIDVVVKKLKSWERRKYLYSTNFAVKHADFEVAPYIALTDLFDANIGLLDTINKSMTPAIRESKYGKKLETYISKIKENN